ncbi:MAG: hypothetical protein WBL68_12230 [Nitrososphaeraceae archaeon]
MNKLISVQNARIGAVSAILLLSTIMLNTSVNNENLVFAQNFSFVPYQIVPDLEMIGSDQSSSNSTSNMDESNVNEAFTDLSGSSDGTGTYEQESETIKTNYDNTVTINKQTVTSPTEEQSNTVVDPLGEEIKNQLNEALSGITVP